MKSKFGVLTLLIALSLGAFSNSVLADQSPKLEKKEQSTAGKSADKKAILAAEKAAKKAAAAQAKAAKKAAKAKAKADAKAKKQAKKAAKLAAKEKKRLDKEIAKGPKAVEPAVSHRVPEIDAAGAPLALALMAGCMALIRERRRRQVLIK